MPIHRGTERPCQRQAACRPRRVGSRQPLPLLNPRLPGGRRPVHPIARRMRRCSLTGRWEMLGALCDALITISLQRCGDAGRLWACRPRFMTTRGVASLSPDDGRAGDAAGKRGTAPLRHATARLAAGSGRRHLPFQRCIRRWHGHLPCRPLASPAPNGKREWPRTATPSDSAAASAATDTAEAFPKSAQGSVPSRIQPSYQADVASGSTAPA